MYRLELIDITKRYPGCVANQDVNLRVRPGEIHALMGENGAGKSTLMKIIYGVVKPDSGQVLWQGKECVIRGPAHARTLGIGMVFQHFSLFETLTVAENIALSLPPEESRSFTQLNERIRTVSAQYGIALEPERHVYTLSIGERQRVEIVRCLLQNIHLLILDEPTSVLTPQETTALFHTLQQLAANGCSILFISHKLNEVQQLCDTATILRSGKIAGTCTPTTTSTDELARLMVGGEVETTIITNNKNEHSVEVSAATTPILSVKQLDFQPEDAFATRLKAIDFDVYPGEILGIAGVAGNGQSELLRILSGECLSDQQSVLLQGKALGHLGPAERRRAGMAVVPEERLERGAVANLSLQQNYFLTSYPQLPNSAWHIDWQMMKQRTLDIIQRFKVKAAGPDAQAKSLSGGNLQKFILGRELSQQPAVLICSHPTWGVDIGAARMIHQALMDLRNQGAAIVIISEDIDELYQLCDRLCAIYHGQLSPCKATDELPLNQLGQWMMGVANNTTTGIPAPC